VIWNRLVLPLCYFYYVILMKRRHKVLVCKMLDMMPFPVFATTVLIPHSVLGCGVSWKRVQSVAIPEGRSAEVWTLCYPMLPGVAGIWPRVTSNMRQTMAAYPADSQEIDPVRNIF
jgi:hypothetical protein